MRHDAMRRRAREPREALGLGAYWPLRAVRAPFDGEERAAETRQGASLRRREWETLRLGLRACLEERAGAAHAGVEMVEERVVDHAEDWDALVYQA